MIGALGAAVGVGDVVEVEAGKGVAVGCDRGGQLGDPFRDRRGLQHGPRACRRGEFRQCERALECRWRDLHRSLPVLARHGDDEVRLLHHLLREQATAVGGSVDAVGAELEEHLLGDGGVDHRMGARAADHRVALEFAGEEKLGGG